VGLVLCLFGVGLMRQKKPSRKRSKEVYRKDDRAGCPKRGHYSGGKSSGKAAPPSPRSLLRRATRASGTFRRAGVKGARERIKRARGHALGQDLDISKFSAVKKEEKVLTHVSPTIAIRKRGGIRDRGVK